jgi:hypothetical protein
MMAKLFRQKTYKLDVPPLFYVPSTIYSLKDKDEFLGNTYIYAEPEIL